jgi:prolyl oligopeptidase
MFFEKTGFTSPGTSYRVEFYKTAPTTPTLFRTISVAGISPHDFVTDQVFFNSKDGTVIPMFLTSLKDVARDGTAPVLQYGYGGFSVSMDPFFSPSLLTWIKHYRGVLAVVNLRGGGEYGEAWHLQGVKEKKQNVFDDFIYASKYLIKEKIGAADKIAISGGSNGGLLVAAVANQAPELYAACIADVGVMDMLRFDRFTIGRAWKSDYGDPAVPADFDYLHNYSPLENVPFPSDLSSPYPP